MLQILAPSTHSHKVNKIWYIIVNETTPTIEDCQVGIADLKSIILISSGGNVHPMT
jgi:hypothetical protein